MSEQSTAEARRAAEEIAKLLLKLNWLNSHRGVKRPRTTAQAFNAVVKDLLTADIFEPGGIQPILKRYAAEREREALERAAALICGECKRGDRPHRPPHRKVIGPRDWWHDDGIRCSADAVWDAIRALVGSVDRAEAESK